MPEQSGRRKHESTPPEPQPSLKASLLEGGIDWLLDFREKNGQARKGSTQCRCRVSMQWAIAKYCPGMASQIAAKEEDNLQPATCN
jgi:hypothetical protein